MERAKKRAAAQAAVEARERQANRGWLSWAWGGGSIASAGGHHEDTDADMRADLNDEEREALKELVSEQEDALTFGAHISIFMCLAASTPRLIPLLQLCNREAYMHLLFVI